ncbi:MAG: ferritin-like domain-containing protein [Candidatus Latescibacteria bacterium]|nr:ferritin-like domain-containing protein [Candidatus Latescibacterota bacterium]
MTRDEGAAIAQSLKAFQAGEGSEGKHLLRYAGEYAKRTGDQEYVAAIRLFIAEEQRHARDLGRFLTLNAIPLAHTTFTDRVFRRLRNLIGSLEVSIGVLVTAEMIANVYYAVVREATRSIVLRRLCEQILRDEVRHVQFQAEQLGKLRTDRSWVGMAVTMNLHYFLYLGTVWVVWLTHCRAIRRGGLGCFGWWKSCWAEFREAFPSPSPHQAIRRLGLGRTS